MSFRLRNPQYTGENRCWACTIINISIAMVLVIAIVELLNSVTSTWTAALGGLIVLSGTGLLITYRGYLIPGTPSLTQRFLPDTILRWFGKSTITPDTDVDPDEILADLEVLSQRNDSKSLAEPFVTSWQQHLDVLTGHDAPPLDLLDTVHGSMCIETFEGGLRTTTADGVEWQWPSNAALSADTVSAATLTCYTQRWSPRTQEQELAVLRGIRLYIGTCPSCGGTIELEQANAPSCCRNEIIQQRTCIDCGEPMYRFGASR